MSNNKSTTSNPPTNVALRTIRTRKGLTLAQAAKNLGVSQPAVTMVERDQMFRGVATNVGTLVRYLRRGYGAGLEITAIVNGQRVQVATLPERGVKTGTRAA